MATNKWQPEKWTFGVKLESKEDYDRLMNDFSEEPAGFFLTGIDYKGLFDGEYPEEYPGLVTYVIDSNPIGFMFVTHIQKILDAGYTVVIHKGED